MVRELAELVDAALAYLAARDRATVASKAKLASLHIDPEALQMAERRADTLTEGLDDVIDEEGAALARLRAAAAPFDERALFEDADE